MIEKNLQSALEHFSILVWTVILNWFLFSRITTECIDLPSEVWVHIMEKKNPVKMMSLIVNTNIHSMNIAYSYLCDFFFTCSH